MRKTGILIALLAAALTGCGGGNPADDAFQPGQTPSTSPITPTVAALTVTTSSPTIPSDDSAPADIKVYAKNANNQLMSGVPVTIAASSGALQVTGGTTDITGTATAKLSTGGDPSRRTITVTATSGTVTASVKVVVGGSVLTVQGPAQLNLGQSGTYTVALVDAGNHGIANQAVTIASSKSNTLSATSVTTSSTGQATFSVTAANGGNDTITVSASGLQASQAVAVSADAFLFSAPAANTEVALGATQTVTVNWKIAGAAQVGQTVTFSTTRGTVTPTSGVTDGSGNVTATISATNAGGAVISATGGSSSAQLAVEFIATVPASIDVQPSSFSIATGQTSTITAVVRDASGNLVKNKTVNFTLQDVTGGTLSVGSAVTDSQGRAQTVYTASSTTSANQGVTITGTVQGTAIAKAVSITVARREVFISLGTGNEIEEPTIATYRATYAVTLTDANGQGVANVPLSLRILSIRYYKGYRQAGTSSWLTHYTVTAGNAPLVATACLDEDANHNGVLDLVNGVIGTGEDFNSSGRIEAGNIASVSPVTGSTATTDANGQALLYVTYPQEYAYYLDVQLSVSATVQGTEYVRSATFPLDGTASDFNTLTNAPPGLVSPFGQSTTCSDTL